MELLRRCETVRRRLPVLEHRLINNVARQATAQQLEGKLSHAIAEWMLISRAEAARRIQEAGELGHRKGLSGDPLARTLSATAAGQRQGTMGTGQVAVSAGPAGSCPAGSTTRPANAQKPGWPGKAPPTGPNSWPRWPPPWPTASTQDGTYRDEDRARRRGLTLGDQHADGMSQLRGWLTPELRATLEAVPPSWPRQAWAKPRGLEPVRGRAPTQEAIDADNRSGAQRNHDALNAGCDK